MFTCYPADANSNVNSLFVMSLNSKQQTSFTYRSFFLNTVICVKKVLHGVMNYIKLWAVLTEIIAEKGIIIGYTLQLLEYT